MQIYTILGMISNYAGGMNLDKGVVQRFMVSDGTKKIKACQKEFEEFFAALEHESDLEIIQNKTGSIDFKSIFICQAIEKLLLPNSFMGRDYLKLSEELFENVELDKYYDLKATGNIQRLYFLKGALLRHENEGVYYFYNDYEKAILVHRILSRFADEENKIVMTSTFLTPWAIQLTIEKEELFWNKINELND